MVPAWSAPGPLAACSRSSPHGLLVGTRLRPVTSLGPRPGGRRSCCPSDWCTSSARRLLYRRATADDTELDRADRAAREQYAVLSGTIERREQERLVHDTVLNTLTALARAALALPAAVPFRPGGGRGSRLPPGRGPDRGRARAPPVTRPHPPPVPGGLLPALRAVVADSAPRA